ncbi:Prolyl endopeptidase [Sesamum alatum]|uniref:Prolyl endopeptidase n=1 Tax=Sesamum alatum TaxID=300844 RepID=A0AAE2CUJ8_9LAMI|nr:Prolyl endopeptidase [Sesamum alatum]
MGSLPAFDEPLQYPAARRDESVVDNYHGVMVPDPYRWLEDPDSAETKEFVEKQMKLTDSVLKTCETREKLREKLTELYDFPKYSAPSRAGGKYFFFHNTGLQPQRVLYVQDSLDGKPEVLLDPNTLSEDGTVALTAYAVSEDAKYMAYGISSSGSDWITIKVMRIEDKCIESDTISWVKFSCISWTHDSRGFFYSRYPAPENGNKLDAGTETNANLHHELYYHFLGTDQSEDILCWSDPDNPKHTRSAKVTEDGKYVLLYTYENCDPVNKIYYCNISVLPRGLEGYKGTKELLPFVKLVDTFDALYQYIANDGAIFTFLTNKDAPRNKLVRVDLEEPTSWNEVLREDKKDVLESAVAVNGNKIVVNYLSDVKNVLQLRDLETEAETPDMRIFREIDVPGFDRTEFNVNQVFVPSKDGSKIPIFIVARKGISLDGSHPCLLYGYGGFNVSITPYFSVSRILIAKHLDVIFCIANIRGGGEYGEEWHKAGALSRKQNCFDDFISAAEYLVSAGYTQPRKLCIEGGSNGGLLIGACVNQRPDLFGCALAHVGVMDMLRFHKFTIGHAWTSDFGCSDKEEDFRWLIKYSPLHNVSRPWDKPSHMFTQYPSTMLLTADHDDRVVPLHSLKLLATMQYVLCSSLEKSPQTNPIVVRIERKAGHGAGMPTQKMIDETADRYSFMAKMVDAFWID